MFHIETRDHTLRKTVGSYDVPYYIVKDSKYFSAMLDLDDDEVDDNKDTMNIWVNDVYFKKILEYYEHYKEYFTGEVEVNEEDKINVVTRPMLHNTSALAKRDAGRKIIRRNDIPTEVFYIDTKKEKKQRLELANEQSMLSLEEFTEKWMNAFERKFVEDFHWISPKSKDYPTETDGVLTLNEHDASSGAATTTEKLSIRRMIDYCGFHMNGVKGERGLLQFYSLGKFLNQWVMTTMASKTWSEMNELCGLSSESDSK